MVALCINGGCLCDSLLVGPVEGRLLLLDCWS